eukprot:CAMPEP_0182437120 /NCGR_PEP_ID=MMETSP1167-20130531/84825_1 /TAXON_ID=2988 /ORGANISM="Mallomonas Sp, Strain CCMP3275" /LENGTH=305 /DNA_ID=CAMNT_0024629917 /DNA_START=246 /DNA_END=1163 /DNA_ORIENTATION=-
MLRTINNSVVSVSREKIYQELSSIDLSSIAATANITRDDERAVVQYEKLQSRISSEENNENNIPQSLIFYHRILLELAIRIIGRLSKHLIEPNEALFNAVSRENLAFVAVLLRLGANVRSLEYDTNRGLLHVCRSAEMVDLLVFFGADIHHKTISGQSALHHAVNRKVAERLVQRGIRVTVRCNAGGTVLHSAKTLSTVQFFLDQGVEVNATNLCGYTAMHLLVTYGNWEIVYLLLRAGADPFICGRDGLQPGPLACAVRSTLLLYCRSLDKMDPKAMKELYRMDYTIHMLQRYCSLLFSYLYVA